MATREGQAIGRMTDRQTSQTAAESEPGNEVNLKVEEAVGNEQVNHQIDRQECRTCEQASKNRHGKGESDKDRQT
jgi:hypothetical protein